MERVGERLPVAEEPTLRPHPWADKPKKKGHTLIWRLIPHPTSGYIRRVNRPVLYEVSKATDGVWWVRAKVWRKMGHKEFDETTSWRPSIMNGALNTERVLPYNRDKWVCGPWRAFARLPNLVKVATRCYQSGVI